MTDWFLNLLSLAIVASVLFTLGRYVWRWISEIFWWWAVLRNRTKEEDEPPTNVS